MVVLTGFSTCHKKPLSSLPDKSGQPKGAVLLTTIESTFCFVNTKFDNPEGLPGE